MAKSLADSAHVYQHRLAARRSSAERDWVLAIGQWDQLLTYWPDDIEALTSKARIISVELSQPDDAFVIYEIAAKYAPWNVEARYGLCETKSKTDRYYEGIRACEDVLELKKNHIGALRGIAGLLARAGQVKSSEDVYKRLIEQLDTREQLDEVLADLKGHPETAVSGSNAPLRLVPILRAFWESDTLSLQRQDRIKLQEIISQRLDPVVEAALSGVANNTGNVDSVELEIQGLAHLGGDERALADLMVQLSRGGALFVKEGLNQGVLAHLRSLESRVPEQLGRSHPFNKTALQFRVLSVLNGNRGEQARSDGRDALLKLARLAYGPHSLEMQQALSTAAVLSQFDGNTRGRLVALAESQAILEGVMGPGSEQAASLLGKLISSVDDVGDRPSLEPLLLRY
ncbi:hypothetical protein CATMQ487_29620 [Sphaerotilus microaerophilus]|uniref:Tetratricopeptide repeat protein n=2 Tax=Sphaerotilus microaerophilus TaxID=2914710 RepID=A0ABN6PPJ8_9BURK|nr:hypothetical protein CATMQ487_29620 [Sphaerotilus sp. FB-5]